MTLCPVPRQTAPDPCCLASHKVERWQASWCISDICRRERDSAAPTVLYMVALAVLVLPRSRYAARVCGQRSRIYAHGLPHVRQRRKICMQHTSQTQTSPTGNAGCPAGMIGVTSPVAGLTRSHVAKAERVQPGPTADVPVMAAATALVRAVMHAVAAHEANYDWPRRNRLHSKPKAAAGIGKQQMSPNVYVNRRNVTLD